MDHVFLHVNLIIIQILKVNIANHAMPPVVAVRGQQARPVLLATIQINMLLLMDLAKVYYSFLS
jgi:hypothetical protein